MVLTFLFWAGSIASLDSEQGAAAGQDQRQHVYAGRKLIYALAVYRGCGPNKGKVGDADMPALRENT